jgi:hypothetical protein
VIEAEKATDQAALAMAMALCGELAEQGDLHADRGCRYTSAQLAIRPAAKRGSLGRPHCRVLRRCPA